MSRHGKVLVAMSGGVDSSVTALLLHEEGYEVIGVTMKTWDYAQSGGGKRLTGCCDLDSINDARELAVSRGIHHIILDIREEFGDAIIGNFVSEYLGGRTPNPCVLCNTFIKWEALLKRADMLDCGLIATGHYARVREEAGRWVVSRGLDPAKDQSYVLWGVGQESLARTRFPVGGFHKAGDRGHRSAQRLRAACGQERELRDMLHSRQRLPGLPQAPGAGDHRTPGPWAPGVDHRRGARRA